MCVCVCPRACACVHASVCTFSNGHTYLCCVRVQVHLYSGVHTHGCGCGGQKSILGVLFASLELSTKHPLSDHLRTFRIDSAGQQAQETLLSSSGIRAFATTPMYIMFYICIYYVLYRFWGVNTGSRSCKASILPTERSLSISIFWVAQAGHRLLSS